MGDWIKHLFDGNLGTKIRDEIPTVIIVNIMIPNYAEWRLAREEGTQRSGSNVVLLVRSATFAKRR